MKKKSETTIPPETAAKVLFLADRTCCVCRKQGKPVQIHHIDGNHENHDIRNLSVLCLDCHTETQISGGFHRKLDAHQVILYRDDWNACVNRRRAITDATDGDGDDHSGPDIQALTTTLDILAQRKQYWLLAIRYNSIGNIDLRDKYIELALAENNDDDDLTIFLRGLQGRKDLIPKDLIERVIERRKGYKDWSQLARVYKDIGDSKNAVLMYCKSIIEDVEQDEAFPAAFYLKEMCEEGLAEKLFEEAFKKFSESGDLWWQVRSLQELGWNSELKQLLISNRSRIESSGNTLLLQYLYEATGEKEKYYEQMKKEAEFSEIAQKDDDEK
jgi:hypothetical protein